VRPRRERRLQPPGAGGRARLAPGRAAARLLEVPAADRRAVLAGLGRADPGPLPAAGAPAGGAVPGPLRAGQPDPGPAARGDEATVRVLQEVVDAFAGDRAARAAAVREALLKLLDRVDSLDDDRILRSFIDVIDATLRTSYYQRNADGQPAETISFKFDPALIPELPKPRPYREIFVYGPRVEGVHLRFGPVARGGLRWSDRREDFRTEVLGLVKAQMVKNTVIVPVGAKGGFYA